MDNNRNTKTNTKIKTQKQVNLREGRVTQLPTRSVKTKTNREIK
jgi:hypothetical protein